jgi:hypothetical protein
MKRTIRANLAFFLGRKDEMTMIEWLTLAALMTNERAENIVKNIPGKFQMLTGNDISRYSEMEILEMIITDSVLTLDTRLGPLQYYARKRLLELHTNPTAHDSDSNTGLPSGAPGVQDQET